VDAKFRHCKLSLSAWHTDCLKNSDVNHYEWHVCFWCMYSKSELGNYVPADKQHPLHNYNLYILLSENNIEAADPQLSSCHFHQGFDMFEHLPYILANVSKPNLLNTIQICMLDHLGIYHFHFMPTFQLLDKYNAIRLSEPAYNNLILKNKCR